MAKSLIERLPVGMRSRFLQGLSRNARGPGSPLTPKAYGTGPIGRGASTWLGSGSGVRGIVPIEVRAGTATADIAVIPPAGVAITLDYGTGATPATGVHSDKNFATVAYAPGGAKVVTVTAPADYAGQVAFTV
jgi:hypothetical protein